MGDGDVTRESMLFQWIPVVIRAVMYSHCRRPYECVR